MIAEQALAHLPDGTHLRGSLWRVSDNWMLMLHEPGADHDIDELASLVRAVVRSGASAVAFDLPGHGFSEGDGDGDVDLSEVVCSLVDWIDRISPVRVGIVAIGATCYPTLQVAQDHTIDTLILVSPTPNPKLRSDPQIFRGGGAAKLIIVGGAEPDTRDTAIELRQRSIGWAVTLSVGSAEQGAALITGAHSARVEEGVELFLREQWTMGRRRGVLVHERERKIAR